MTFVGVIVTNKFALWAASYSACVVYTKTSIHLSVGESGGYLPPLRWIIVNYYLLKANWSLLFWLGFRFPTECSSDYIHVYNGTIYADQGAMYMQQEQNTVTCF